MTADLLTLGVIATAGALAGALAVLRRLRDHHDRRRHADATPMVRAFERRWEAR